MGFQPQIRQKIFAFINVWDSSSLSLLLFSAFPFHFFNFSSITERNPAALETRKQSMKFFEFKVGIRVQLTVTAATS